MRICVTGGSGFLGSHVADALTKAGHKVVIYDMTESPYLLPTQTMVVGNVLDRKLMFQTLKSVDMVFHLAAIAGIEASEENPYEAMKVNMLGTTNVLEACRLNGIRRVVFASTIYVNSRAGSLYRVSKQSGELLIKAYHDYCGMNYTIVRFGTLYGTRASKHSSVYNLLKEAITTGAIRFKGTGKEVREYIHVRDAADICVKLVDSHINETLTLTGQHRITLAELLDTINEVLGNSISISYHPLDNRSHYEITPNTYSPDISKHIVPDTYCDFGSSLVEILAEIDNAGKGSNGTA